MEIAEQLYSIKNIRITFKKLIKYRDKKSEERKKANLVSYELLSRGLNKRQADLIGFLYLKDKNNVTLNSYAEKYEIVRLTASKDINELIRLD